jgi:hypothetical protein
MAAWRGSCSVRATRGRARFIPWVCPEQARLTLGKMREHLAALGLRPALASTAGRTAPRIGPLQQRQPIRRSCWTDKFGLNRAIDHRTMTLKCTLLPVERSLYERGAYAGSRRVCSSASILGSTEFFFCARVIVRMHLPAMTQTAVRRMHPDARRNLAGHGC